MKKTMMLAVLGFSLPIATAASAASWCMRSEPITAIEEYDQKVDPILAATATPKQLRQLEREAKSNREACDCETCIEITVN